MILEKKLLFSSAEKEVEELWTFVPFWLCCCAGEMFESQNEFYSDRTHIPCN